MIVIAAKPGQLGNMLVLFANFIGRAIESGLTVSNLAFDDYAAYFPATRDDLLCRFPARRSRFRDARLRRALYRLSNFMVRLVARLGGTLGPLRTITLRDWTTVFRLDSAAFLETARSGRTVLVRGWLFRDPPMFRKHAHVIRQFFEPLPSICANIDTLVRRARLGADLLVGIHIRHGYLYHEAWRKHWYPPEQYAELMAKTQNLFSNRSVRFLICSDRQQSADIFSRFGFVFGSGHVVEDMYSLARCDYLLGPPSTYTMWASFYGSVPLYTIIDPNRGPTIQEFNVVVET